MAVTFIDAAAAAAVKTGWEDIHGCKAHMKKRKAPDFL